MVLAKPIGQCAIARLVASILLPAVLAYFGNEVMTRLILRVMRGDEFLRILGKGIQETFKTVFFRNVLVQYFEEFERRRRAEMQSAMDRDRQYRDLASRLKDDPATRRAAAEALGAARRRQNEDDRRRRGGGSGVYF